MVEMKSIPRIIRQAYVYQSNSPAIARQWFIGFNRFAYVIMSCNHLVPLRKGLYKTSVKGKIHPLVKCIICNNEEKIRLVGWRPYYKSCRKKRKYLTIKSAKEINDANPYIGIYECDWCNGYHRTKTPFNPKIQGHKRPIATLWENPKNPLWDLVNKEELELFEIDLMYPSPDEEILIDNIHSMMYVSDPDPDCVVFSDNEIEEWMLQKKMGQDIDTFGEAVDRNKGVVLFQNAIGKCSSRSGLK